MKYHKLFSVILQYFCFAGDLAAVRIIGVSLI